MSGLGGTFLSHEEIQCRRMPMYVKRVDVHGEEIPMEIKFEFGRPLPEGATVSKTGKVYLKGTSIVPCPHCETGWKGLKSEQCGACWTRQAKAEGGPKAIKAKKAAVAVTRTDAPHPQATPPQPSGTFATIGGQEETNQKEIEKATKDLVEAILSAGKAYATLLAIRLRFVEEGEDHYRKEIDALLGRFSSAPGLSSVVGDEAAAQGYKGIVARAIEFWPMVYAPGAIAAGRAISLSELVSLKNISPPAPVHDGLVEELAQQYAEKIRARALQILGMGS